MARPRCPRCLDEGHVCEDHPAFPWEGLHGTVDGHAEHGGAGMPCPACCSPIPEDGAHSIAEAFTPDWMRAAGRIRTGVTASGSIADSGAFATVPPPGTRSPRHAAS